MEKKLRMPVGGAHIDYAGNEVYVFRPDGTWVLDLVRKEWRQEVIAERETAALMERLKRS